MATDGLDALFFAGSSHPVLAKEIAQSLGISLGKIEIGTFPDGELSVHVDESVRGRVVFVMQSIVRHPNRYLMELLLIVDALKRSAAKSIIAVLPYYGYSRQDRKDKPRVPITAKLVADLLSTAGVTQVLTMDLHAEQLQGFFDIPVDSLKGRSVLLEAVQGVVSGDLVVATPDVGSVKLARAYASDLGVGLVICDKDRISAHQVGPVAVIGTVEGKNVLLADDMCSTAGTLVSAAKACQEKGARRIFAVATHGLFVGDAIDRIERSPIEALFVGNTVPTTDRAASCSKIHPVSLASLIGHAMHNIVTAESIQSLC